MLYPTYPQPYGSGFSVSVKYSKAGLFHAGELDSIKRAKGTRAKIRNIMSAIFHHAMRYEWVKRNPIKLVRQSAKRERTPDVLELAELQLLLSKLTVRERTLALLDATTGLRVFSVTDISNNAFFEKVMSQLAAINCPSSRFYVQVDWICKHWRHISTIPP